MDDDLNSPMVISALFDWVRVINQLAEGRQTITAADLETLKTTVRRYAFDILGLRDEKAAGSASGRDYVTPLVEMLLDERLKARAAKDWAASDRIRDGWPPPESASRTARTAATGSWNSCLPIFGRRPPERTPECGARFLPPAGSVRGVVRAVCRMSAVPGGVGPHVREVIPGNRHSTEI